MLDVAIIVCIILFAQVDHVAAALMFPYLLWSLFATALSFELWHLNPNTVGLYCASQFGYKPEL